MSSYSDSTRHGLFDLVANAIRSVDLDSMTLEDIASILEKGDVADEEARRVFAALEAAGFTFRHRRGDIRAALAKSSEGSA